MIEYKYQKVKGLSEKKFLENGHTMFEEDVLQRLKRLAYLEEQIKQGQLLPIESVRGSFSDKDLLNGYCAGALETLTNKEATFLGYDHLNKINKEAEEWKERYTNDR